MASVTGKANSAALSPRVNKSQANRWVVHELASTTSTNWVAASLPAWQAVRAEVQTAGRGRFQRSWISDHGGLWLSAVVPLERALGEEKLLALGAGLSVVNAVSLFGVTGARLRWPNDVLIGDRKLAGVLIDQFVSGLAVIGIGINVTNRPGDFDPTLSKHVVTLKELVSRPPSLAKLTDVVLENLATVILRLRTEPESVLREINLLWDLPRRVEVDLDGRRVEGQFEGIAIDGGLRLQRLDGPLDTFAPHEVRLLRDL